VRGSKILYMALQAQLNDESFIHFATQKTKLGEKVINLSLRQCVIFFLFFLFVVQGIFLFVVQAFFCSWCKALLVSPIHDR
jgi:hypothetical protein